VDASNVVAINELERKPFVGIDPDDTLEVEEGGAVITIGVINQGAWQRLYTESLLATESAKRRTIKRLADEGVEPESIAFEANGIPVTVLAVETHADPALQDQMHDIQTRAARLAVRHHRNIQKRDGSPVPCVTEKKQIAGRAATVLSEETLAFYAANQMLLSAVWSGLRRLQTLGAVEKKD
jgi:hypothetical protein